MKKILLNAVLFLVLIIMVFPMFWMLLLSLKQYPESMHTFWNIITSKYTLINYKETFLSDNFLNYFINSTIVATAVTLCNLLFCTMTGYVLATKKFTGRNILLATVLGLLIIPSHVVMIPLYRIMVELNWLNTYWSLIIPWIVTPFGVFLAKQYIESIPMQIEEAARLDGAGDWYIFFRIILPLCKPILSVLAIYTFINNWNSFLFPFLFTNDAEYSTLPVGLTFYLGKQSIDWGHLMAGASISAIPILCIFMIFQKKIVEAISSGALKE
ncbi:MAG: carbohydrate ABC transporter permease [Ignavibacteria bacterium]|nr:carbohydrate ABC transporter permease [Ignavibacteria bacterium]